MQLQNVFGPQPTSWRGTQSPAPTPAAPAPRAATPPPRHRAWLRIFVFRCGLPCDPPGWGSFMQWRDDTTLPSRGLCVLMTARGQERRIGAPRNISALPPRTDVGVDTVESR